jgi:hypothetical protein
MVDSNGSRQDEPQEDEPLVRKEWACPNCGEQRMDYLACEEDNVSCHTCGAKYVLPAPTKGRDK